METSAKASINVEEAFLTLASDIKAKTEKRMVSVRVARLGQSVFFTVANHLHPLCAQEANNPPKGGHQLKPMDSRTKDSWLSRCSLLWRGNVRSALKRHGGNDYTVVVYGGNYEVVVFLTPVRFEYKQDPDKRTLTDI